MTGFVLDTNIPSEVTKPRPDAAVLKWLESIAEHQAFLSVVSLGEIRKGCELMEPGRRRTALEHWLENDVREWFEGRILPIDQAIAERWGVLDAKRQKLGRPLNAADGQIAATALEYGLSVATRNLEDFDGLGLTIINPWRLG